MAYIIQGKALNYGASYLGNYCSFFFTCGAYPSEDFSFSFLTMGFIIQKNFFELGCISFRVFFLNKELLFYFFFS